MSTLPARAASLNTVSCDRIRHGRPVKEDIAFTYRDAGKNLAELTMFSDWSVRREVFRDVSTYAVEEVWIGMEGRSFLLHRSEADIEADRKAGIGDPDTRYGVFVARNGQDDLCECRGFAAHCRCKHVSIVRHLVEAGHIDRPGSDAPVEQFPSPEQVRDDAAVDAMIVAPY